MRKSPRPPLHPYGGTPAPERRRLSNGTWAILGVAALTTAIAAGTVMGYRAANDEPRAAEANPNDGPATASAPQYPTLEATPQTPIQPTPEASSTTPAPAETHTATAKPTPNDVYAALRRAAATRFNNCNLNSFTNDGPATVDGRKVTQLNADILFETNPQSETAREQGGNKLKTTNPRIILAPITKEGIPAKKGWMTINTGSDKMPHHPTFNMPANAPKNSFYAVGIETTATTPGIEEGHNKTTSIAYCGEIKNLGDGEWREPADNERLNVPALTTFDTGADYPG